MPVREADMVTLVQTCGFHSDTIIGETWKDRSTSIHLVHFLRWAEASGTRLSPEDAFPRPRHRAPGVRRLPRICQHCSGTRLWHQRPAGSRWLVATRRVPATAVTCHWLIKAPAADRKDACRGRRADSPTAVTPDACYWERCHIRREPAAAPWEGPVACNAHQASLSKFSREKSSDCQKVEARRGERGVRGSARCTRKQRELSPKRTSRGHEFLTYPCVLSNHQANIWESIWTCQILLSAHSASWRSCVSSCH